MKKYVKPCSECEYFSPNPYNGRVGACMDSAHDGVYEQVKAEMPACLVGLGIRPTVRRRFCPSCNTWLDEDEFVYDKNSADKLSRLCHSCKRKG